MRFADHIQFDYGHAADQHGSNAACAVLYRLLQDPELDLAALRRLLNLEGRIVFELVQVVCRRKENVRQFDDRELLEPDRVVVLGLNDPGSRMR